MSSLSPGCQLLDLDTGQASKVVRVPSSSWTQRSWYDKDDAHGDDDGVSITGGPPPNAAILACKVWVCLCDDLAAALPADVKGWWMDTSVGIQAQNQAHSLYL